MRIIYVALITTLLVACGTTSGIKQSGEVASNLDLSEYNNIVILDFGDGTKNKNLPEYAGKNFADRISSAIRGKGVFENVSREKSDKPSVTISGNITRYAEGNAVLKFMIGFGAGSTYFDALVKFNDSITDKGLGEILVDKNSWALGGAIAAGQSVEQFMNESAEKIANELAKAKHPKNVALK